MHPNSCPRYCAKMSEQGVRIALFESRTNEVFCVVVRD